jgi:hypothetical protein
LAEHCAKLGYTKKSMDPLFKAGTAEDQIASKCKFSDVGMVADIAIDTQRGVNRLRAFAESGLNVGLDAATESNKEERETSKMAARKKRQTGNSPNKRDAPTTKRAIEPAAKTATGETGEIDIFRIAPNVKLTGSALLRSPG